jgi:diguanylate cyclase (GGDEF)-like protein
VAARLGFRSGIALPLSDGGAPAALVCMYSDRGDPPQPQEFALLQDLAENVSFGLGALRTARENQRAQADLTYAASHDLVTGLPRFAAIEAMLAGWLAPDDATLALLMIDLDRFHAVNESLGHRRADEVLACMGTRLRAYLAPGVALAHFAGDEYVVARSGVDEAGAIAFAEELRAAIAAPLEGDGYRVQLSSTIGVALAPAHGREPLDLLRRAQFAMERGKKRGRDRVEPFRLEQMQDIEDRVLLGERLRQATANGELRLHYQPQIDAQTRRIVGFEALLRWTHPELGNVSPARFIPIGESLGLMPDIGGWVLREACRQARAWIDAGRGGFTVAVNVSPQQLQRDGLVQAVADALTEARLPPQVLEIEFTETSLMENVTRVQGELAKLKALGVTLSLDDFGTGYSSLAYLKQFSLDKLKIDQGFVRGLPANADDAAIAGMIVAIGHQLRLCVVAEGVETAEQADFLQRLGCDGLQGYHFGRPLAVEDVAQRWDAD